MEDLEKKRRHRRQMLLLQNYDQETGGGYMFEGEKITIPRIVEPGLLRQYVYLHKFDKTRLERMIGLVEATEKNDESRRIALAQKLAGVKLPRSYCPDIAPCEPKHLCCHTSGDRVVVLEEQRDAKTGFFYLRTCFYGVCETLFDVKQPYYKIRNSPRALLDLKEIALPVNKGTDAVYVPAIDGLFTDDPILVLRFINAIVKNNRVVVQLWNRYEYAALKDVLQKIEEIPPCLSTEPAICKRRVHGKLYAVVIMLLIAALYMAFSI